MKKCRICGIELLDGINWSSSNAKIKSKICKQCDVEKAKKYNKNHIEHIKEYKKEYNKNNPEKIAKWHSINNPIHSPRRIRFKTKQILLKENPRTGMCSKCDKKIGDDIKRTHMHHIKYHKNDPLKDTIELCISCHIKEHSKKNVK